MTEVVKMRKNNLFIILFLIVIFIISLSISGICEITDSPSIPISNLDFENAEIRQIMKTLSEIGEQPITGSQNFITRHLLPGGS